MLRIPFVSWDRIHSGACAWDAEKRCTPVDVPRGVELRPETARKTDPVLEADRPWEYGRLAWAQIMRDDGRFRMWYGVSGPERLLCYAESDDGFSWTKPDLGLVEVEGSTANNVVLYGMGANHFSVTVDPTAPADSRYRMWTFHSWWEGAPGEELDDDEGHRRLDAKNAAKEDTETLPVSLQGKMRGFTSPDGLRWTALEKPVLDEWHDTHNICAYDPDAGIYRGYFRGFHGERRAVSYSETDDFSRWPATRVIHFCGVDDEAGDSLYSNCYTRYPDVPGLHLMFPANYRLSDDTVEGQLAVSADGVNWSRFTRRVVVPRGGPGDRDEGYVYPEPDLIRFDDGTFRLPLRCGPVFHNQNYVEAGDSDAFVGWAEWPEDRLCGVHAEADGAFTTQMIPCGERMLANYRCEHDGWVRFELVDRLLWPPKPWPGIDGYRFDDATPLTGDAGHAPALWNGSPDLSALAGRNVAVRVRLYKATLFSIVMYGADDPGVGEDPRFPV